MLALQILSNNSSYSYSGSSALSQASLPSSFSESSKSSYSSCSTDSSNESESNHSSTSDISAFFCAFSIALSLYSSANQLANSSYQPFLVPSTKISYIAESVGSLCICDLINLSTSSLVISTDNVQLFTIPLDVHALSPVSP